MPQELRPFHEVVIKKLQSEMGRDSSQYTIILTLCDILKESRVPNPGALVDQLESLRRWRSFGDKRVLDEVIANLRARELAEVATADPQRRTTS